MEFFLDKVDTWSLNELILHSRILDRPGLDSWEHVGKKC